MIGAIVILLSFICQCYRNAITLADQNTDGTSLTLLAMFQIYSPNIDFEIFLSLIPSRNFTRQE